jgi:hypothetical protein
MRLNVFVRELVVHDTAERGDGAGEYEVVFAANPEGSTSELKETPVWISTVRRAESYEVLHWLGPFDVPDSVRLVIAAYGREKDLAGSDRLLGGVACMSPTDQWGVDRWWRTTNGKHFDFTFAVTRAEQEHAGRPPYSGGVGAIQPAPGPQQPTDADYPAART